MKEQAEAYIKYLAEFGEVSKPAMPNFDLQAYTENEYIKTIAAIENNFLYTDSMALTIDYLKGE